jgi:hypothetical protein
MTVRGGGPESPNATIVKKLVFNVEGGNSTREDAP